MVEIKGNLTAKNLQINENVSGNVSFRIDSSPEAYDELIESIKLLIQESGVIAPDLEEVIDNKGDTPEGVVSKISSIVESLKAQVDKGRSIYNLGVNSASFLNSLISIFSSNN